MPERAERVVVLTIEPPPGETTHWTAPAMATAVGISVSSAQRIWRAHGLQPHQLRQFKPLAGCTVMLGATLANGTRLRRRCVAAHFSGCPACCSG
jgi:hypothetical protein